MQRSIERERLGPAATCHCETNTGYQMQLETANMFHVIYAGVRGPRRAVRALRTAGPGSNERHVTVTCNLSIHSPATCRSRATRARCLLVETYQTTDPASVCAASPVRDAARPPSSDIHRVACSAWPVAVSFHSQWLLSRTIAFIKSTTVNKTNSTQSTSEFVTFILQ